MRESAQHLIDNVRRPRVHITYDVEIGDAVEQKELPFVMGVIANLSGEPLEDLPNMKQRKFVELDADTFGPLLESINPHVKVKVKDTLSPPAEVKEGEEVEEKHLVVDLSFKSMDDFGPLQIVKQVEPLKALYDDMEKLKNIQIKIDGNDPLETLMTQVMTDDKARADLLSQIQEAKKEFESPAEEKK